MAVSKRNTRFISHYKVFKRLTLGTATLQLDSNTSGTSCSLEDLLVFESLFHLLNALNLLVVLADTIDTPIPI